MQATARMASVVLSTLPARRRLIRVVRLRKRTFLAGMNFYSLMQKIALIFLLCAASCRAELYYPTDDASWQTTTAAVAGSDPVFLADAVNLWLSLVGELRRYQRPTPAALRRGAAFGSAVSRRASGSLQRARARVGN